MKNELLHLVSEGKVPTMTVVDVTDTDIHRAMPNVLVPKEFELQKGDTFMIAARYVKVDLQQAMEQEDDE